MAKVEERTNSKGEPTKVRQCTSTCLSPYQDMAYGRGMRVFNKTDKAFRCTVCGDESAK
jgi:hypothetical protein